MVVKKTSFEEEQAAKEKAWLDLTPQQRLEHHQPLLKKIYGDRYNAPMTEEARKIKIRRGNDAYPIP